MPINPQCHIIAITGGKGGVGKSVFAVNFAQALMLEMRAPVLLLDLDSQSCGDLNILAGLRPNKTVSDLSTYSGAITQSSIPNIVVAHSTGFHFVGAVKNAGDSNQINTDGLRKALEGLSGSYAYIVADIGSQFFAPQLAVLENASCALVITPPEMLAINQTLRMMNQLIAMAFPTDMMQVVLNRASATSPMSPQAAASALRKNPIGIVPQDDAIASQALARSTPFVAVQARAPIAIAYHETVRRLTGSLEKLRQLNKPRGVKATEEKTEVKVFGAASATQTRPNEVRNQEGFDVRTALKQRLLQGLIEALDLNKKVRDIQGDKAKENELRVKTQQTISSLLDKENQNFPREQRMQIIKEVLDEALGLGPLEDLLADSAITEIMVNRRDLIYVEKNGKLTRTDASFTSDKQLMLIIERIVTPLNRHIDTASPYVDARLKDGSRVNAIIPPLSVDGPCMTIRKFARTPITFKDYVRFGTMTEPMIDFLRICVENKLNILISGGTGSGKTTLLNVLSGFIPATERIVTVEDAAELQLKQDHVVRLETRPPSLEKTGAVTIRDLVRNTLRMRPDRIVVGECRGGEALDMLQAMNTGHDGSLTTIHANTPSDAIRRLETLCLQAGEALPQKAIREQIASAIHLIVQISRLSDGSRKITSITEVAGMQGETPTLAEIYHFKEEGFDKNRKIIGRFLSRGIIPTFIEDFEKKGVKVPRTLFTAQTAAGPAETTKIGGIKR